jgi:hypothetical protein
VMVKYLFLTYKKPIESEQKKKELTQSANSLYKLIT